MDAYSRKIPASPIVKESQEAVRMMPRAELQKMQMQLGASALVAIPDVDYNFEKFAKQALRMGYIPPILEPAAAREELHNLHCWTLWARDGLNVFNLSESLTAGFLLTEPAEVEGRLKLPFASFSICIPPGYLPMFGNAGEQWWADTIWVHEFSAPHLSIGTNRDFLRWTVSGRGLNLWMDADPDNLEDPNLHKYKLKQVWEEDPPAVPADSTTLDCALNLVRNLLSWLDSTGGIKSQRSTYRPEKNHNKRKNDEVRPIIWMLGHEVKLSAEVKRMAKEIVLGGTQHAIDGWKVRVRYVVRGHWRLQPCGPQLSLRKKIWISPFWKGPEGAAAWSHIYVDKKEDGL